MTSEQYYDGCKRTWSNKGDNLEHCVYGLITESAEILDMLKKHKFYGRELDMVNLREELGDLEYYMSILYKEIGYSQDEARIDNIAKLSKRYPDKFKDKVVRDVEDELSHIDNKPIIKGL